MPIVLIGAVLLVFLNRKNLAGGAAGALCKKQQSTNTPPACSISSTCCGKGPIQPRTPQVKPPTNFPIPTGMFAYDCSGIVVVQTANAASAMFLDALGNILAQIPLQNGQSAEFNFACYLQGCGCAWAWCGGQDTFVASVRLQGPGGTTNLKNPFYTPASALQCNSIQTCASCIAPLQVKGTAFQGERNNGLRRPVNRWVA